MPDEKPRDWRWADAPRPDLDTGRATLAPTAAADDVPALRAEARAWCADPAASLRSAVVADLDHALGVALARAEAAERDRDALRHELDALRDDVERLLAAECPPDKPCPRLRALADERDRFARRLRAVVAIGRGARVPDELADAPADPEPGGRTTR